MSKGTVNRVILVGRLGNDPDIKYTSGGTAVARLSIATVDGVKKGDSWEDVTEWHRIVVFGKQAEFCNNYLHKGSSVYIEGRLKTNQWEDQSGAKRTTTEILASEIQMIGGNGNGGSTSNDNRNSKSSSGSGNKSASQNNNSGNSRSSGSRNTKFDDFDNGYDDDIPF